MRTRQLVTAIALALALGLSSCGDTTEDSPGTDTSASPGDSASIEPAAAPVLTTIPDDFPLALGMTRDNEVDQLATSDQPGIRDFTFCGTDPLAAAQPTDLRNVDNSGGESFHTRDLRLFASPEDARGTVKAIRAAARSCPEQETEGIPVAHNEVRSSPLAQAPSFVLLERYATDDVVGPDVMVTHVVLAGNAVLMARTYGQDGDRLVDETATALSRTVEAMALFDDGVAPAVPAVVELNAEGAGGITLGMRRAAVEQVATLLPEHGEACTWFRRRAGDARVEGFVGPSGRVVGVMVRGGSSPEGVGPGTTVEQLRENYSGTVITRERTEVTAEVPHSSRQWRFGTRRDVVTWVALEQLDNPCPWRGAL